MVEVKKVMDIWDMGIMELELEESIGISMIDL